MEHSPKSIFSFLTNTKYCITVLNGEKITGIITKTFPDGIEIQGIRIPENKIVYWSEAQ